MSERLPRHFPLLLYAVSLYLQSLRGVRIRGAFYGMLEALGEPKPIIDLQPLLELPEWFYAVRVFRETGTVRPISERLNNIAMRLHRRQPQRARFAMHRPAGEITGSARSWKVWLSVMNRVFP